MPIQQLSKECLVEIFKFGSNLDRPCGKNDSPFLLHPSYRGASPDSVYTAAFQVAVSHVCRQWRDTAVNIPYFWTTLHFSKPSHIAKARVFLERCKPGQYPIGDDDQGFDKYCLDILILTVARREMKVNKNLIDKHLQEIFEILTPRSLLWRSFHLQVRDRHSKAVARRAIGSDLSAPRLQTLQLYHFEGFGTPHDYDEVKQRPKPVVCFKDHLPQLKHLSLVGVSLPWTSQYLYQGTLQSLELALHADQIRPSYSVWEDILSANSKLTRLSVNYSGPKIEKGRSCLTVQAHKIYLNHLEHLSLNDLDPDFQSGFLSTLSVPASIHYLPGSPVRDKGEYSTISLFTSASGNNFYQSQVNVCHEFHQHVPVESDRSNEVRHKHAHQLSLLTLFIATYCAFRTSGPKTPGEYLAFITLCDSNSFAT